MWWPQPKQATSATMALVYITVGALMDVWTVIYYIYIRRHGADDTTFLWTYGFFATGIVLMAIGFTLGYIGRTAKQAEVAPPPPTVAAPAAASAVAPAAGQQQQPIVVAVPAAPTAPATPAKVPTTVPH